MKARRRTADGRYARDTQPSTGDTLATATVAAGLVIGAAGQLSPAVAAAQQMPRTDVERTAAGSDHPSPPPAHEPVPVGALDATNLKAATDVSHAPASVTPVPVDDSAELNTAPHRPGALPEAIPDGLQAAAPSEATSASVPAPESLQASLSSIAQSISSAMKTLIDHVEDLKAEMPTLSTLQQQFDGLAQDADRLAQEIASVSDAAAPAPDLSELLGGPALLTVLHTAGPVTELPATLLGAEGPLGAALGNTAPMSTIQDVTPAAPQVSGIDPPHDAAMAVAEVAPLQLGFLGQSYTDSGDAHDFGSHGLVSPLHGFI